MGNYHREIGKIEIKKWYSNSKESRAWKRSNKYYYFKSWGYECLKNNSRLWKWYVWLYINIESLGCKSAFSLGSDAFHDRKLTDRHHATIVLARSLATRDSPGDTTRYLARFSSHNLIFPFNDSTFPNGVSKKSLAITIANCIIVKEGVLLSANP